MRGYLPYRWPKNNIYLCVLPAVIFIEDLCLAPEWKWRQIFTVLVLPIQAPMSWDGLISVYNRVCVRWIEREPVHKDSANDCSRGTRAETPQRVTQTRLECAWT